MLIDEFITVKWHPKNKDALEKNGYLFTKFGDQIQIKPEHLPIQSNVKVKVRCDICGAETIVKYQDYVKCSSKDGLYRCKKCGFEKAQQTNLNKYGVKSLLCIQQIKEEGMLNKYGVKNISQLDNWSEIYKKICQEKYGVDNVFQLEEIKDKSKQTSLEKYGVEYHFQNEDEKDKWCRGEQSPSYIDGRSYDDKNHRNVRNESYREWRRKIYEKDKYKCQICGDDTGHNLNAHHLNGWDQYPDERFSIDNGITLCENCHHKFHKIYGYGNNTKEQFEEFKQSIETNENNE